MQTNAHNYSNDRMAVKKCCIENCNSCSTRREDRGVTYHKFPKDVTSHIEWRSVTRYTHANNNMPIYVCSRHFCKGDFLKNKDSKYILKPDAVPSIFPWTNETVDMDDSQIEELIIHDDEKNVSTSSKGSETENLDAIKKFIEEQEKEIQDKKLELEDHGNGSSENKFENRGDEIERNKSVVEEQEKDMSEQKADTGEQTKESKLDIEQEKEISINKSSNEEQKETLNQEDITEQVEEPTEGINNINEKTFNEHHVATSVMDLIHSESEVKNTHKNYEIDANDISKHTGSNQKTMSPNEKGSSTMALSIGSKVEVRDFGDDWYPAEIDEVDCEEMEVLVRYEVVYKKPDEWINVSSPRLRQYTGTKIKPPPSKDPEPPKEKSLPTKDRSILKEKLLASKEIKTEPKDDVAKSEEKQKLVFVVGERCLARWRDNKRFVATISKDLGDGNYKIIFDDGFHWTCSVARLHKLKNDSLTVDTSYQSTIAGSSASLDIGAAGANNAPASPVIPVFHTDLFDPKPKDDVVKSEEKQKLVFVVGERCLARWRDNKRFVATISKDLGDGNYKIIFDDGFHWTCSVARLHKLKNDSLTVDTSYQSTIAGSSASLDIGAAGANNAPASPVIPVFHTHLFDPTRDYLCSKSERREKKRKLNIKEIFNIGQKKYKIPKTEKEKAPKTPVEKKPRVVKKNDSQKVPRVVLMKEIKTELPDAVASIIGTKDSDEAVKYSEADANIQKIKTSEITAENIDFEKLSDNTSTITKKIKEEVEDMYVDSMEPESCVVNPNDSMLDDEDSDEPKSEGDPVHEEEVTLENFEKQDTEKHEAVIDKIKEAIIKLEDGISEIEKRHSPKVERALTPKLERVVTPNLEAERLSTPKLEICLSPKPEITLSPKLEEADTPKSVDLGIKLDTTEPTKEYNKPQDLKDVLAEVAASIDIGDSKIEKEDSTNSETPVVDKSLEPKPKRDPTKIKKNKKLRLLQEKKVKMQVEKVKNELEMMKRQFEAMRKQMMSQEFTQMHENAPLPESALLPGEWCCRWVNGQPVGKVSEVEGSPNQAPDDRPALPRRSVEVQDKRLPPGWTKHMVRRSFGHSAGKWDVVLVSPEEHGNRRFHTKNEIRNFIEQSQDETLKECKYALTDFGAHLKLARRMCWVVNTPDGIAEAPETILPADATCHISPLVKRKKLNLKRREGLIKPKKRKLMMKDKKRRPIKLKLQKKQQCYNSQLVEGESSAEIQADSADSVFEPPLMPLEDGYVYVGSLKVQMIDNLLRCPAEGCFKNFRTKTLLQMHIKHYHRDLIKMMGATPKVLDLAYARTMPVEADVPQTDKKVIKVKINKPPRRDEPKIPPSDMDLCMEGKPMTPSKCDDTPPIMPRIPRSQDSPKLRQALNPRPVKRPKVLLPVRRLEPEQEIPDSIIDDDEFDNEDIEPVVEIPMLEHPLDFETAISTHTVTKPLEKKKKGDKKKSFALFSKNISEDEEWFAMNSDELDTRSSFPLSGSPDSKMDGKMAPMSSESNDDQKDPNLYTYTETGERIKIVHMKREEIINCHCGVREEDGLMVQCELCLCWQHALCHNIQKECEVPEKYTCSICLNPRRGRRSMRFVHDQDRLYEGLLPGARACHSLRRAHELAANLLRLQDALHALRVKNYVATKKDHPKLYLWASDWEQAEISYTQEKLNSDYSDLNIMINGMDKENHRIRREREHDHIHAPEEDEEPEQDSELSIMINGMDKENLPVRTEREHDEIQTEDEEQESDRLSQRDNQLGSHSLLSGLLSSPGGASLDLPISTSELERLAKSVQESSEWQRVTAPQPEAAIENEACRARLLKHIERCQALIDTRLDSIEAQVAELESQDPSFGEYYETAEFYPRTKQTVQMLLRDLDTMEELGVIT